MMRPPLTVMGQTAHGAGLGVWEIPGFDLDTFRNLLESCASINSGMGNSNKPVIEVIF